LITARAKGAALMSRAAAEPAPSRHAVPLAVVAMVLSAACWGGATTLTKEALSHLPPFTLLAVQLAVSVAFLWTVLLVGRGQVAWCGQTARVAFAGVLEPGLAYAAGTAGLALTGAGRASLIGATEPLLIILLAFVLFGARPRVGQLALIFVAVAGLVLVVAPSLIAGGNEHLLGDGLILLATFFAAGYVVLTSWAVRDAAPLTVAALQQSVGLLFALVLATVAIVIGFETPSFRDVPLSAWLLIGASGIVQYAAAFWLYLLGLRVLPVGTAALFLALIPVFGLAAAAAFLGERLTSPQLIGSALVVAAVAAAACLPSHEP
jgi:drug/metabolite transporter (DMT)-like permease